MDSTDSEGNDVFQEKIKIPKHLIEKKRRARINNCLGELKKLVIEKDFLRGHRSSKLEKADILELTVEYLKRKTKLPYPVAENANISDVQNILYARGYRECIEQVSRHIKNTGIDKSVSNALLTELETVAQKLFPKDSKITGAHTKSSCSEANSHTSVPKNSTQSDGPHPPLKYVTSTTETHVDTHTNSSKLQSNKNFQISPKPKEEIHQKWQMLSSNAYNSLRTLTDVTRLPSASIKSPREQMVHVDAHDVPSMCPVVGSLQSVTVLVPCQVLASAIPQINTTQYQTLSHICEHAELGKPLVNHSGYSNTFSVNASCVSVNTVAQNNARDNADDPLQDKYACSFESIPLQSPWRPW